MADSSGERSKFFPAIEKKHGGPVSKWMERVRDLGDATYADQISLLQNDYGFSRAHANAVVMYVRGSATSRRHASPDEYFASIDQDAACTAREIFAAIVKANPKLELVVAWNQPMLKADAGYVFGLSAAKKHLTLNPFSNAVIESFSPELTGLGVNKSTFTVPIGWKVNATLLRRMVKARLKELG